MTPEKQIEEMKQDLESHTCMSEFQAEIASKVLYAKGYRKASDVAAEIFAEIEKLLARYYVEWRFCRYDGYPIEGFAELKKKYTGSEENDGQTY